MNKTFTLILVSVALIACNHQPETVFPLLTGAYLGQKPPGNTPEVFAPGIVSTGLYTRDIAMTPDGKEMYFCISDPSATAVFVTKLEEGRWTEPVIAPFSGKGFFDFEPHISPDGKKFFFLSNRPPAGMAPNTGWHYQNIWMMDKTDAGWSEPKLVEKLAGPDKYSFFPSVTKKNVLYYTGNSETGKSRIFRSVFQNNIFEEPEMVPLNIPDKGILFNAFISPDEDYLITCALNVDSTNTDQDYYISFKSSDGKWSNLIRFGSDINAPGDNGSSAFVSRDGNYLFFNSSRTDSTRSKIKTGSSLKDIIAAKSVPGYGSSAIYWVDAKVIEEIKLKNFK
jgi:hypothetical protein